MVTVTTMSSRSIRSSSSMPSRDARYVTPEEAATVDEVKAALTQVGVTGMTTSEVRR